MLLKMKQKLIRLEDELSNLIKQDYDIVMKNQGEPQRGHRGGNRYINALDGLASKIANKRKEIEEQKEKIEKKKAKSFDKENHLRNGFLDNKSIYNLEALKQKKNAYAKKSVKQLEAVLKYCDKNPITEDIQKLIDAKIITQWVKQPMYFFIKGFQKVALKIIDGKLIISNKYPAKDEEEKNAIYEILDKQLKK